MICYDAPGDVSTKMGSVIVKVADHMLQTLVRRPKLARTRRGGKQQVVTSPSAKPDLSMSLGQLDSFQSKRCSKCQSTNECPTIGRKSF